MIRKKKNKIVIIGLDGASWPVLEKLADEGKLPNIKHLMDTGVSGPLMSLDVTASPIVWTSIASGKLPERHGVKEFIVDASCVKVKRFWDIAEENNFSIGMYEWLVTFPVRPVNGFMVPGWLATAPEAFPHDLSFIKELELSFKGGVRINLFRQIKAVIKAINKGGRLSTIFKLGIYGVLFKLLPFISVEYSYLKVREATLSLHMEIFKSLLKQFKPDVSAALITEIDNISHRYWMYYEPDKFPDVVMKNQKRFSKAVPGMYMEADRKIGKILKDLDEDTTVFVISDHGFQALTVSQRISPQKVFSRTKFENLFNHWYIGAELYLKAPETDRGLIKELKQFLCDAYNPEKQIPLFEVEDKEKDVISVRISKIAFEYTDLESLLKMEFKLGDEMVCIPQLMESGSYFMSGFHAPEGILIARGRDLKKGARIENASVLDITPTILRLLDLPLDREMDGKVLEQGICKRFLETHEIKMVDSYAVGDRDSFQDLTRGDQEAITERLKELGYM